MKLDMVSKEVREELIAEAKKYGKDDFKLFCDEYGWKDWMNDFTEAEEAEALPERDAEEIDAILKESFDLAHAKRIVYEFTPEWTGDGQIFSYDKDEIIDKAREIIDNIPANISGHEKYYICGYEVNAHENDSAEEAYKKTYQQAYDNDEDFNAVSCEEINQLKRID